MLSDRPAGSLTNFAFICMFVHRLYYTNLQSGCTLLHDAACGGSVELLKWLVEEKGLDVQEWNKVFLYFKKIAA